MSKSVKNRQPDFRAAHRVKAPGLQTIMGYLLPKRTDCEVYINDEIDVTELLKYLEKKNAEHPEYKTTVFHCAIAAMAKMVKERPLINRYIQNWRMYEREVVSLSFVVKRRFADSAEESLMVLVPTDDDNIDSISRKIIGDVKEIRKSETATGGVDQTLDTFAALPWPILALAVRVIRWLDFWGHTPKALSDGDPNYTTILASNLGSIKCTSVYHHINNYGTNSIVVTFGAMHKSKVIMDDGSEEIRTFIDIGATLDERIADGFYFAKSLKLIRYMFDNPEVLDIPIGEPSGFDFDD